MYLYLPNFKEDSKIYTPLGIINLFAQAVKEKSGDIQAVFDDKHQYKNLIELWHAGFLALSIRKWLNKKFVLYPADAPDIYFIDEDQKEAFPIEIMELYFHNQIFSNDYKKLAKNVFDKKGKINFPQCHLLIVLRINNEQFNISNFCREIKKFKWNFERIWFEIHTAKIKQWTFFELFPGNKSNDKKFIYFNLDQDKDFWY